MDLVLRAALFFVLLYVVMRLIGRRELSSLEPFDLVLLVVMGDLVQQAVTQSDYSVTGGALVIGTMVLMSVAASYLTYRVRRLRPLLDGEPIVLIADGEVLERSLRRERITLEELGAAARQQQIESLDDVRFAVLETNGKISMIERSG
ncbi:MAG TPA: YetF domain-containing protein [Solirubrobacteraceae bacterium]|jgi:uncharacterized membrane protein YcaP (DUF421 family)|nr:YetF domain-containing protein [Solirubrobacteraceae bacterium]